jgi:hypothetical protein
MKLTAKQEKFLELSKQYENLKKQMKELKPALQDLMAEIGIGKHFQDSKTGAVYEITIPKGTYISFDPISYERTRLEGESKGSLSLKKAEELGYTVK